MQCRGREGSRNKQHSSSIFAPPQIAPGDYHHEGMRVNYPHPLPTSLITNLTTGWLWGGRGGGKHLF